MDTHTERKQPATKTGLTRKQIAAKASAERKRRSALRAADDPDVLAKAARVVRAALETGRLTKSDLDGPIVQAGR